MKIAGRAWKFVLAVVMLVALSASPMWAQENPHPVAAKSAGHPQAASEKFPTIKYETYKLANGLQVILSEDHRLPLVAVDLWYHVGPANERPGRTGFAHLFEHMMFQGSKHVGNFDKVIEGIGSTESNGTTGFDRTNYFETVPSDQLETALWVESDRMGWLLDGLNETKLKNQRDVVRNERRQSREGQPYGLVQEGLFHLVYPKTHPYYAVVIGSHADIEAADLKDVRDFFKTYYAPNNATIAIVGDFETKAVKALMEKYFGAIPAGPPVPKIDALTPPITQERRAVIPDKVQLPRVYMAWLTPAIYKPGDADADLLSSILGGGKSSRLYKKLVYEKQIAQDVNADQENMMLGSLFIITATAKPGVKPEELERAIEEELAAVQKEGVTQAEVERARNTIETRTIQGLQRLGGFGGKADLLNHYNHYTGDPGYLAKDLARYNNVTTASVQKLSQTLTANSRAVVYGVPGEKVIEDVPARPAPAQTAEKMPGGPGGDEWRNTQPKPGKRSALQLPVPKEFKLPNGMQVYLVEQHEVPVLTAQLTVLRGSEANPADRSGLASFTAQVMNEGTDKRTAGQLADDIAQIGASLNAGSSADASAVTGGALTKNADKLFELLGDVALHPAFREEEIERVRKRRMTTLLQQNDNPGILANRVFMHEVYGDKSPYGFLETGTAASTTATTREDMLKFYKSGFAPQDAALVVAGDVTEAQLKVLGKKYLGGWTGQATASKPPMASSTLSRRVVIVDKPNAPQSALRIGQVGLQRSHPDFVPVTVMNDILGGMFSSRINMNLREVHGYTYGAFSQFQFRRGTGPFVVGSMIRTDVTAPAVKEVFAELERMRMTEVSSDELSAAKETLERGLTAEFETTSRTAGTMSNLFVYGLPLDYYRGLPAKIGAVSAADVRRTAEKYLAPDKMVVVVAGDRAKIEPDLKKLDLGTVEAQDTEGKPIVEKAGGEQ